MELLDRLEQQYAPPDHPVFELVPAAFNACATDAYRKLGNPQVNISSFWGIYQNLLSCFNEALVQSAHLRNAIASSHIVSLEPADIPLLPGLKPLRKGQNPIGSGLSEDGGDFGEPEYAKFTDSEPDTDSSGPDTDEGAGEE